MGAMVGSTLVLIATPIVLVAVGLIWYRRSQRAGGDGSGAG